MYAIDKHPFQEGEGGVEILLVSSCYRNQDRMELGGPPGLHCQMWFRTLLCVRPSLEKCSTMYVTYIKINIIIRITQSCNNYFASLVTGGFGGLLPSRSVSRVFINSVSVWEYCNKQKQAAASRVIAMLRPS